MYKEVKVRLSLDKQKFSSKPTGSMVGAISSRLANRIEELTIEELSKQLVSPNGRTFSPAVFSNGQRKNEFWISQQIFALDVDNGLTIQDAVARCEEFKIKPVFIYSSFSHSEEHHKFRMVFLLDEELSDIRVRNFVQLGLAVVFPETDQSTKDLARLFFGGKKLEYCDFNNVISVPEVHRAAVRYIKETKGKNDSRDLAIFAQKAGVHLRNGIPHLETFNSKHDIAGLQIGELDYVNLKENRTNPIVYIIGNVQYSFSSNYLIRFSNNQNAYYGDIKKFDINKSKETRDLIRNFDFQELEDTCQLFREGKSGEYWLEHGDMFGLMTNLLAIKGGSAEIAKILNARKEYSAKMDSWNTMVNQIQKSAYAPKQCDNFCPFADDCMHGRNMIEQGKMFRGGVQTVETQEEKSLDEAKEELKKVFNEILKSDEKGFFIVKAPTGIGKSELFIRAAKRKHITVALPTHKLKNEIMNRMLDSGVKKLFVTPELPKLSEDVSERLNRLYRIGAQRTANMYLRDLVEKGHEDADVIEDYLYLLERARKLRNTTILTTHQRAIYHRDQNDVLIVDEDIIPTLFPQSSISLSEFVLAISKIINSLEDNETISLLEALQKKVLDADHNIVQKMESCFFKSPGAIEKAISKDLEINGDILGFLNCINFVKTKSQYGNVEFINFIGRKELPSKKVIILSATINEEISKMVFDKVFNVNMKFYDIGAVENKGTIIQIPYKSFSRYSFNKNKAEMSFLKEALIDTYNPYSWEISYKQFNDMAALNIPAFGSTAGSDVLNGENITIVGTPNLNPISYILFASALNYTIGHDDNKMEYKPVVRNGFRFYYQTFGLNDKLQEIQFYLVESELIQAVGRARALIKEATVLVLSNLPVPGAEFINLNKNDIIKIKNNYIRKQNSFKKQG
ncbi:hypothetical protein [Paenibacillus contaminans]|uniref:Helicase ATP-binding domain-containing protein n=1 Tax=Paenibacillus contaminans TaxID=450362 RepID=A0A329MVP6_9BACL|nr:hypothetical protein [Paenibacillus contaminans]RAV22653.1 hypothetical protein DQG23_00080 [Paenibacillus contaminans]